MVRGDPRTPQAVWGSDRNHARWETVATSRFQARARSRALLMLSCPLRQRQRHTHPTAQPLLLPSLLVSREHHIAWLVFRSRCTSLELRDSEIPVYRHPLLHSSQHSLEERLLPFPSPPMRGQLTVHSRDEDIVKTFSVGGLYRARTDSLLFNHGLSLLPSTLLRCPSSAGSRCSRWSLLRVTALQ